MLEPSLSLLGTVTPVCFGQERRHWRNWSQRFCVDYAEYLVSLLRDKDEKVRRAGVEGLAKLTPRALSI